MPNAPVAAAAEGLPKFSRRSLLAGGSVITGAALAQVFAATAADHRAGDPLDPDRALRSLGRDFEMMIAETTRRDLSDADADARQRLMTRLALYISLYQPQTLEGLRVKLQAYLWQTMDVWSLDDWRIEGAGEPEFPAEMMQLSLAGDVARLREARS